jgi:hypothetical protein
MAAQRSHSTSPGPKALSAEELSYGSWSTRWGDWVIHLRGEDGHWRVTVWRWTVGGGYTERTQLGMCAGFATPLAAAAWACSVLEENGAKVFVIDKPQLRLEKFLRFNPAPEAVT